MLKPPRTLFVVAAVVAGVSLTGCQPVQTTATGSGQITSTATSDHPMVATDKPTTTPVPTATVTVTPKPTAKPTAKPLTVPQPSDTAPAPGPNNVLGPYGIGHLYLGMTPDAANNTGEVSLMPVSPGDFGICHQHSIPADPQGFAFALFSDDLNLVAISAWPGVSTPQGIKIGSSYAELHAAYPDWQSVNPDTPEEGHGWAGVPGNPNAVYRINVLDDKVAGFTLQLETQDCYE